MTALAMFLFPTVVCLIAFVIGMRREQRTLFNGFTLTAGIGWLLFVALIYWLGSGTESDGSAIVKTLVVIGAIPLGLLGIGILLILNGREVIRKEGRSLGHVLAPALGACCVGLLVYTAFAVIANSFSAFWVLVAAAPLLGYLAFLLISWVVYAEVYARWPRTRPVDAIIVHGAGLIGGNVTPLLARRLDTGIRAFERWLRQPTIICSGGQGPDEPRSEAAAMREYLLAHGVPDNKIALEDRSTTTEENLAYSHEIMPTGASALMVTSGYHALRAGLLARRLRMNAQATGAPVALYYVPSATLREFVAWLVMTKWWHLAVLVGYLAILARFIVT